ncbi:hypothetical protein FDB24_11375 [Clostridium botulinum]|uniref:hypothetical protein n=1 Tax=Clostridium botulinum TaxID=1491 RepID=UPI000774799C|nr:hypothetical protein [Clostridium botulinum]NFL86827.1 hypothetical protein [Clostridium botulinum]NFO21853.1 hypothetical protein [Clostridium botulinum]
MTEEARMARNEYMREYRAKNKRKVKEIQKNYWERKVATMEMKEKIYKNNLESLFILIHQGMTGAFANLDEIEEKINTIGVEKFREIFSDEQLRFLVGNLVNTIK